MEGKSILIQIGEMVAENEYLKTKVSDMEEMYINSNKFYNAALTTEVVASLHQVSAGLVRRYIALGLIDTHPMSSDAKLLVRGSDALRLDFKELKQQAKLLNGAI